MYTFQQICLNSADVHTCQQNRVSNKMNFIPQNSTILLKQDLAIHIQQSLRRLLHWLHMPLKRANTMILVTQLSALHIHQLQQWLHHWFLKVDHHNDPSHTSFSIPQPFTTPHAILVKTVYIYICCCCCCCCCCLCKDLCINSLHK